MDKRTKPIVASLLMLTILSMTAACQTLSSRKESDRAVSVNRPATQSAIAPPKELIPIPNQREAARKAQHCLNVLCYTGASEGAISEASDLAAQLDATPQPFARTISQMLKNVISYRGGGMTTRPVIPGVPSDLINYAAASCDARGRRRPGEIVLSFAGDCTFGTVNGDDSEIRFPSVYRRAGRPDYPFALLRPWFLNDDLTVVNFECTLTDATQTADKEWKFKGPAQYASIFPAGSVEAAGLSNNHSFDYRQTGFTDTVNNFRKAHVPVFYQNAPYSTRIQGSEVVLIGDCTVVGENTTKMDGVPERVLNQIKRYKKSDNIVIVVMHWGSELDTVPSPWQQELGRKFIDAGADAVVGHHPHVVQGIELYKGKYIAYSLGNFAFGGNSLARYPETFVLQLRFQKEDGKTSVKEASIVPCFVTTSHAKNEAGILHNNYQPKPVFGETANRTVALILQRSARLAYGIKKIPYLQLP